jgi:predicted transcriptional regulator
MVKTASDVFRENLKEIVGDEARNVTKLAKLAQVSRTSIYDLREGIANALGFTLSQMIRLPTERDEHNIDECFRRVSVHFRNSRKMRMK